MATNSHGSTVCAFLSMNHYMLFIVNSLCNHQSCVMHNIQCSTAILDIAITEAKRGKACSNVMGVHYKLPEKVIIAHVDRTFESLLSALCTQYAVFKQSTWLCGEDSCVKPQDDHSPNCTEFPDFSTPLL